MAQLRNRVQELLDERQLSRTELAELTGLPTRTIRRLSRPDSDPLLEPALRISRILQTPLDDLFWLEDDHAVARRR